MRKFEGFLNGINLGGWLSQCVSYDKKHFDEFITEEDFKYIKSLGFDHVRLPIDYDVIEEENGEIKPEGYAHIEDAIKYCRKLNLNVVLDLHKSCGFMFDTKEVPDPDKFFTDEKLQQRFLDTWERLISHFGKDKDIVAFELLNEVVNPDFTQKWNEIASRAIKLIRKYESDAYIILGGVMHNNVTCVSRLDPPADKFIVYNFHCYDPLCFTHQHAHWVENIDYDLSYPAPIELYIEKSKILKQAHAGAIFSDGLSEVGPAFFEKLFEDAISYAETMDVPLYCGEYGVIDKAPSEDALRWLTDINSVFEKSGIGRALWNYKQKDFGITELYPADKADALKKALWLNN